MWWIYQLNGRDVIGLAATLPGVSNVSAPQQLTDARSGPTMNVNGGYINQNLFTFNGGIFVDPSRETAMNYPPPDAIQEFSIQTQDFSAEFGRNAGSQVNVVSKSGSNNLHGAAWEFLRNNDLNARNFFVATVPSYKQNQYGAAVGGPIRRDKLFFFGSYQGTQNYGGALSAQLTVPTTAQRNGDFTGYPKTLTDPVNPITGQPFMAPGGALCIQNNIVNPGCITTMAKTLLPLIPQSASGTATTYGPQPEIDNMYLGRIDWNQSAKNVVSGHVYIDHNLLKRLNLVSGSIPNYLSGSLGEQTSMGTVNDTYSFRPNLLNQLTIAFLRNASLSTTNKNIDPSTLGVNSPLYAEAGALNITVGSLFSFGGGGGRTVFTNNNWQFRDAANWVKGKHSFKFGGEYLRLHFRQIFIGPPTFSFTGTRSGSEFADFLIGAFYSYTGSFGVTTNDNYQQAPSLFFQDEFKATSRFTLTYGVRWEPFLPWNDRYNRLASLAGIYSSPSPQSTIFPSAPPGSPATNRTRGIFYFYGPPEKRPWATRFTGGDYRGFSDLWRIPKASYWFIKAQWTEQPFVYIVGHWTWPGTEGKSRNVRIYSTCDEVELFLNGKSLGKRQPATTEELMAEWRKYGLLERHSELPPGAKLRHAPFIWRDVPYEPGTLNAVGTKGGKQFVDKRVTAGKPYQIVLQPDRERISAGGRDAVRIVATIVDEHGIMIPSANPWLTFRAGGPGDLLGTPVFDAVWGMGAINIQSRAEPGELAVTATSRGLKEGHCRIVSEAPR